MMEQSPEMIGGSGRQTHLMRSFVSRHNHFSDCLHFLYFLYFVYFYIYISLFLNNVSLFIDVPITRAF